MFNLTLLVTADAQSGTNSPHPLGTAMTHVDNKTKTGTTTPNPTLVKQKKAKVQAALDKKEKDCEELKPAKVVESISAMPNDEAMKQAEYANCLFAFTWAKVYHNDWLEHGTTMEPVGTGDEPLPSEEEFAEVIWAHRYGDVWNSCRPKPQYQNALTIMNANFDPTETDGLANCVTNENGSIASCTCSKDFGEYFKQLSKDDKQLILHGNCLKEADKDKPDVCIPGAKHVVDTFQKKVPNCDDKCAAGWKWYAILETISLILDSYTKSVHMRVPDVYWINYNFSYMFRRRCPSAQTFAIYRPIPYMPCVDYEMVSLKQKELEDKQATTASR